MKRVILIHGWGGNPDEGWFPWLEKELESKGFKVERPAMPESMKPKIDSWVSKVKEVAGEVDEQTYFVGHSIGCQTIMRYLEQLPEKSKIGGVVLVGGWFNLKEQTYDDDEDKKIAEPWLNNPIDFEKVKNHTNNFVYIGSDDDPYVPISDADLFKERLNAKIIILKNKGHICEEAGVNEVPEVLEELMRMSNE